MQLFELFGSYYHEGDTLLGVFSTQERAEEAREVFINHKDFAFDNYHISTSVLDKHWEPDLKKEH